MRFKVGAARTAAVCVCLGSLNAAQAQTSAKSWYDACDDVLLKAKRAAAEEFVKRPPGLMILPTPEMAIAGRRAAEQLCLQFARCIVPEVKDEATKLRHAMAFQSCLIGGATESR